MIVVRNRSATYDDHLVYSDVSMTVMAGEWVVIIGPNGAGKSTLLRSIAGLTDMPGSVAIDGRSIKDISARKRAQKVAFVPQAPLLPAGMSVNDYVLLGRTPYLSLLGTEIEGLQTSRLVAARHREQGRSQGRRPDARPPGGRRSGKTGHFDAFRGRSATGGASPGAGSRAADPLAGRADIRT